jgi:hypothetical protein
MTAGQVKAFLPVAVPPRTTGDAVCLSRRQWGSSLAFRTRFGVELGLWSTLGKWAYNLRNSKRTPNLGLKCSVVVVLCRTAHKIDIMQFNVRSAFSIRNY